MMYGELLLSDAGTAVAPRFAAVKPISSAASRQEGKLLNHHLCVPGELDWSAGEHVEVHAHRFDTRSGDPRCEHVLRNAGSVRAGPTQRTACQSARFPLHLVRQYSGGRQEAIDIRGHVIRLDHVLGILAGRIAPPAYLDRKLVITLR